MEGGAFPFFQELTFSLYLVSWGKKNKFKAMMSLPKRFMP